jgi:hypothetical protein
MERLLFCRGRQVIDETAAKRYAAKHNLILATGNE